jgi:hypothetical protein
MRKKILVEILFLSEKKFVLLEALSWIEKRFQEMN